jgi:hypothetical protein
MELLAGGDIRRRATVEALERVWMIRKAGSGVCQRRDLNLLRNSVNFLVLDCIAVTKADSGCALHRLIANAECATWEGLP